ncbi:MAG: hypothetical protein IKA40_04835, partial [Clostridia bacterium]|nr:hypothetical protein [Clostridia bacterium]
MYRFGYILLSLFTLFMEIIIVIASIESGFFNVLFAGGIFLIIFMFVLGHYEMKMFAAMEDKEVFDWVLFILCFPSVIFTLILALLGKATFEWADSLPKDSPQKSSKTYKVTTDSAGTEVIVDSDGNEVTRVDFVNWD